MLNCRACLWRCVSPADRSLVNALPTRLRSNVTPLLTHRFLRTSAPAVRSENRSQASALATSKPERWETSRMAVNQKRRERNVLHQSAVDKSARGKEPPSDMKIGRRSATKMSTSDWDRRKAELRFLRDPLELAMFVKKELAKGKPAEMLQLVQMASHSMDCVVSWNHIINHHLDTGNITGALKVYNDVCGSSSDSLCGTY
jgi:hypothetical protein